MILYSQHLYEGNPFVAPLDNIRTPRLMEPTSVSNPLNDMKSSKNGLQQAIDVVKQLRHPEHGCPWDLQQTHASLRQYMLEEAYEAVEAIDGGSETHLKEELGDVLLQVLLHAQIAEDSNTFTLNELAETLANKLIYRHPHVFKADSEVVDSLQAVAQQWEDLKVAEKTEEQRDFWANIPKHLPALMQANKVSTKAVKEGFKWPDLETLWQCVTSEFDELHESIETKETLARQEEELGDLLFAVVSLAGHLKIDPEVALFKATQKFITRYKMLKTLTHKNITEHSYEELDNLWREAKQKTGASIV